MSIKNALIIGLGLLLAVRTGTTILKLVAAGREVDMATAQLEEAKTENTKLQERLAEVNSPEFVLKEAKEKLGMGVAGDEIVIPPVEIDYGQFTMDNEIRSDPNWRKWWKLYIRI